MTDQMMSAITTRTVGILNEARDRQQKKLLNDYKALLPEYQRLAWAFCLYNVYGFDPQNPESDGEDIKTIPSIFRKKYLNAIKNIASATSVDEGSVVRWLRGKTLSQKPLSDTLKKLSNHTRIK